MFPSKQDFEIDPYPSHISPSAATLAPPSHQNYHGEAGISELEDADGPPDSASSVAAVVSESLTAEDGRDDSDRLSMEASRSDRSSLEDRMAQKLERMLREPQLWNFEASSSRQ